MHLHWHKKKKINMNTPIWGLFTIFKKTSITSIYTAQTMRQVYCILVQDAYQVRGSPFLFKYTTYMQQHTFKSGESGTIQQ